MSRIEQDVERRLLAAFQHAADAPWYRALLDEHGVSRSAITDASSFVTRCPILSKNNTFDRFPLHQLAPRVSIPDLASVLTSSGHGGRFSFGLTTRRDAEEGPAFIDLALDRAFAIASCPTLAINCLPMGVTFSSRTMTVATISVREDMAVALVRAFGGYYEQILLVMDPLFAKRLIDHAAAERLEWNRHRVQVVIGEEVFGEHFRDYLGACLGLRGADAQAGYIMSSFGVGELGLHLCYETPATIALRRAVGGNPALAVDVLGTPSDDGAPPAILSYEPRRTFMESVDRDPHGFGRLTVSMLDTELPISLLRYQTGDLVRLLDRQAVLAALQRHGIHTIMDLPGELLALQGREKERLPNGSHVAVYKDVLYADHAIARRVTGAIRLTFEGSTCTAHVQLVPGSTADGEMTARLIAALPSSARPLEIVWWPYDRFPFGMTLDYERKFRQYVPRLP
jgi:phenylacetate-CoA ligase